MKSYNLLTSFLWLLASIMRSLHPIVYLVCFLLSVLLARSAYADVVTVQISRHTPFQDDSVHSFEVSTDGQYVVYEAAKSLWSARTMGDSEPVRLNPPPQAPWVFTHYKISPDSNYVVYSVDQDSDNVLELYSVPISGGLAIKLNASMVVSGTLFDEISIDANSTRVVYRAEQDMEGIAELYSVPITGGSVIKLTDALSAAGDVEWNQYALSPDGLWVVYVADRNTDGGEVLYSVPITGGTVNQLSEPLALWEFQFTPDSSHVLYHAELDQDAGNEIFSVSIAGGAVTRLNTLLPSNGEVKGFAVTNDSQDVIYLADQEMDEDFALYRIPVTGGQSVRITPAQPIGTGIAEFAISPDDTQVVYKADPEVHERFELYTVSSTGGSATKISRPFAGDWFRVEHFKISPDGSQVVYDIQRYDPQWKVLPLNHLFSVPITGGPMVELSGYFFSWHFSISPDSTYVVHERGFGEYPKFKAEYYVTPLKGGVLTKLYGLSWLDLAEIQISTTNGFVTYLAYDPSDLAEEPVMKLFIARDAPPQLAFDGGGATGFEQDSVVHLPIRVLPQPIVFSDVAVDYHVIGGTATADVDFTPAAGTVFIRPGEEVKLLPLQLLADSVEEPPETIVVTLSDPHHATLGGTLVMTITVHDGGRPIANFIAINQTAFEAEATVPLTVTLDRPVTLLTATVSYELGGTALPGSDYEIDSDPYLTFRPGEQTQVILMKPQADDLTESTETVTVELKDPFYATLGSQQAMTLTLLDGGPPLVNFEVLTQTVYEQAATAAITVTLDRPPMSFAAEVSYVITDGTATRGRDFVAEDGVLTFQPGETTHIIPITLVEDDIAEVDENLVITLQEPQFAILGSQTVMTLTVQDAPRSVVNFASTTQTLYEQETAAVITVTLDKPTPFFTATIHYAVTGGTAIKGVDFMLEDGTLTFQPGEKIHTIPVMLITDDIQETEETVLITLSEPEGVLLGSHTVMMLTLRDSWPEPTRTYLPLIQQ